jgi:diguanylate cyclase (GGDEF)-like protein
VHLDLFTLLMASGAMWTTLWLLYLFVWMQNRRAVWLLWWGAPYFLSTLVVVIYLRSAGMTDQLTLALGTALVILGFGCLWQGARGFERRRPILWPLAAWLVAWPIVFAIPDLAILPVRLVISSAVATTFFALAASELWRGRGERLPARLPLIFLLVFGSVFYASRIVFLAALPFPLGGRSSEPWAVALYDITVFLLAMLITGLVISLSKERNEATQRGFAHTDALTGLPNRRAFVGQSERLLRRHKQADAPLALLMLDLDHFKSINDRYGHDTGDRVLVEFAQILQGAIRPGDSVFRLGGEEFCCLLPDASLSAAGEIADRLCRSIPARPVDVSGANVRLTVSIGVASTEICDYEIAALCSQADAAVYAAKAAGRNRALVGHERGLGSRKLRAAYAR